MITLITITFASLFVVFLISCLSSSYYFGPNRYSALFSLVYSFVSSLFSSFGRSVGIVLRGLIVFLLTINIIGNIPLMNVGTLYYFITCSMSVSLWVALIIVTFRSQAYSFISHLLPYGSPVALMIFLPLVEVFRQLIRPLTLMIRLSTNLSSGHIMLFMFSYFRLSSLALTSLIYPLLLLLFCLEVAVSLLQAYIFSSLVYLYLVERAGSPVSSDTTLS